MTRLLVAAAALACAIQPAPAGAQSLSSEAAVSTGFSTEEDVSAAAAQIRAFGDAVSGIRFYVEGAWAKTSDEESDAFGAAYPYSNRLQIIEAYAERTFRPLNGVVSLRAGRYRTPFGISSGSDYAYTGFLRAPLLRYDSYFGLSNNFLEHGADVLVGAPWLTFEASVGVPADVGSARRRSDVDTVFRMQSSAGPFIVGASHVRADPYMPERFAKGRMVFTGADVRWMRDGVQLRAEWVKGRPFDGTRTTGWYVDAIVHLIAMGPVTAIARAEQLDYITRPPFDLHARRQTLGARVRLNEGLSVQLNLLRQTGAAAEYASNALDLGVTYSVRRRFHTNN